MKEEIGKVITLNDSITDIYYPFDSITKLNGADPAGIENELYFYHGNHLSSTQIVTDINAGITQQVLYAPFGEVITEYNAYWHNGLIPDYMFNAKEYDEENGMYYYEARYYSPPIFISRDPLFEKKPWINPYAYARNNPLILIDPTGEDEYEFDKKGNLVNRIANEEADIVRIVGRNGKEKVSKSYEYGTIECAGYENITTNDYGKLNITRLEVKDNTQRENMFEFLAENTNVEWGTFNGTDKNGIDRNIISTNHSKQFESSALSIIDNEFLFNGGNVSEYTHSHPNSIFQFSNDPSGYGSMYDKTPKGQGDREVANKYNRLIPNIRVYDARDRIYYNLSPQKYTK
jgi:RHS repeat-associated protein